MINFGLIGAGRWGPNVIGAIIRNKRAQIIAAADTDEDALSNLSTRYPSLLTTLSADEIFKDDQIHAVAICTPVSSHDDLLEAALHHNKHVLVEKPFGLNFDRCQSLCRLASDKNRHILVGHVFLFNASIIALKKIIQSGELGEILHLEAHRTNLVHMRKDVNSVWDLTSDLSIFDFLLDDLPSSKLLEKL